MLWLHQHQNHTFIHRMQELHWAIAHTLRMQHLPTVFIHQFIHHIHWAIPAMVRHIYIRYLFNLISNFDHIRLCWKQSSPFIFHLHRFSIQLLIIFINIFSLWLRIPWVHSSINIWILKMDDESLDGEGELCAIILLVSYT